MPDHPDVDLLEVLMDASSDEEEIVSKSLLEKERERKRNERNKMKMVGIALSVTAVPSVEPKQKLMDPTEPKERINQWAEPEASNLGKGATTCETDSRICNDWCVWGVHFSSIEYQNWGEYRYKNEETRKLFYIYVNV